MTPSDPDSVMTATEKSQKLTNEIAQICTVFKADQKPLSCHGKYNVGTSQHVC